MSNFKYKSLEILRNLVREIFSKNHFMVRCTHLGVIIESQYLLNRVLANPIVNKSDLIDCSPNQCCDLRGPIYKYNEEEDLLLVVGLFFQ